MPALPPSDETLQLIAAVRDALAEHLGADANVEERMLFGSHAFMVNSRLCLAVKHADLLVRLPPAQHTAIAKTPRVRELGARGGMPGCFWVEPDGYDTRVQWERWIDEALAWNPLAKALPRRRTKTDAAARPNTAAARQPRRS